jgi:hypothetical protein
MRPEPLWFYLDPQQLYLFTVENVTSAFKITHRATGKPVITISFMSLIIYNFSIYAK